MLIRLYDYKDKFTSVEIPDNITHIVGVLLSGDMVMIYPFYKDSSDKRLVDEYEGYFRIPKEKFHILNTLEGENLSYRAQALSY